MSWLIDWLIPLAFPTSVVQGLGPTVPQLEISKYSITPYAKVSRQALPKNVKNFTFIKSYAYEIF